MEKLVNCNVSNNQRCKCRTRFATTYKSTLADERRVRMPLRAQSCPVLLWDEFVFAIAQRLYLPSLEPPKKRAAVLQPLISNKSNVNPTIFSTGILNIWHWPSTSIPSWLEPIIYCDGWTDYISGFTTFLIRGKR